MVTAAWDTSTLKALFREGLQCETCCTSFASNDCCCFLDPDTNAWSAVVTYALDDLAEGGVTNTYQSLQNNNLNHALNDTDWWELVSGSESCGNEDWDAFPPFGGPGRTPEFYTLTYKIIWLETLHETTFYSDQLVVLPQPVGAPCAYGFNGTDSDGAPNQVGVQVKDIGMSPAHVAVSATSGRVCNPANLVGTCDPADHLYAVGVAIDECTLAGTFECEAPGEPAGDPCCMFRGCGPGAEEFEYGSIVASWRPGQIPEWDSGTPYFIGDIVAHEGVFYGCTADNTNQEPPNASFWDPL